jgi:hypothetical protein
MRIWSSGTAKAKESPAPPKDAILTAIDAALGFVAGQRWVPRQMALALLETIRDVASEVDASEELHALIDAALEKCDQDRVLAATLVDTLLDIRNATSQARELTRAGMPPPVRS